MITGFDHTSFTVADLDRAVAFWTEAMGFRVDSIGPREHPAFAAITGVPGARLRVAHLLGHGHHMEFIEYVAPPGRTQPAQPNDATCGHVCLTTDDIEGDLARMMAAGATLQGTVTTVTSGPYKGAKALYVRDPNGVLIELDQPA